MTDALRRLVRDRAGDICEYCRLSQALYRVRFEVEHVIALQHDGPTRPDNLALACQHCNRHKGPNIAGLDPDTRQLTRLYNPRTDVWVEHFTWAGARLVGRTGVGRTTVAVLALNAPGLLAVRAELMADGDFPPPD